MTSQRAPRRLRAWLAPLTLMLAVVAAGGFALAGYGYLRVPSAKLPEGVQLPPAITRAAEELSSEVATSAQKIASYPGTLSAQSSLRMPHPHIVPTAGPHVSAKTMSFLFDGVRYSVTPHVATDVYWGAKKSTRLLGQLPVQSDLDWTIEYYHSFTDDPAQKPAIDDLCAQLRAIRERAHLSSDQYLELMAKYVQTIPYDWSTLNDGNGKQRFPVETLVDGKGLCGDKSVLLADLLSHEGYSVALLDFEPEKHMAVGVSGPGKTYASSGYLFLETTAPCYVTDVPAVYTGGMVLSSDPVVVQIGTGAIEYTAADEIEKIITARDSAERAAQRLYDTSKKENLSNDEVVAVNRKLRQAYKAETSLRSNVVDKKGNSVGTFMDRVVALRWLDANAWWL
jgi:hypothetical protein